MSMTRKKSKLLAAEGVFLVSLVIFVISLIPATYTTSSLLLSGTAGGPDSNPSNSPEPLPPLSPINDGLSIISGLVTVFSSLYAIQISRSQAKQRLIDRDMQLREVEILKLELELEKTKKNRITAKKKSQKKRGLGRI